MNANVKEKAEERTPPRPLILVMNDAKAEIVQSVNKSLQERGLPCYLMESILTEALTQIREGARNELAAARAQEVPKKEEVK